MAGRIAVVDAQNRFLRWTERATIHAHRLPHRSVHVVVFDSKGRLVIQKRDRYKDTWPGHWDSSCAGHVEESDYVAGPDERLDEVYHQVALRELQEELGITAELELLDRFAPQEGVHYEHLQLFRATSDGPYTIQDDEVEEVWAITPQELKVVIEAGLEPVTRMLRFLAVWLEASGHWPTAEG